jgi:uncharacterized protein (DUF488 family)
MITTAPSASTTKMKSPKRGKAPNAIFTIGYQGRTPEQLIALLLNAGIDQLLDVRYNAISRKPGFSKGSLSAACEIAGISYLHLRELGVPSSYRTDLKTDRDHVKMLKYYRLKLLPLVATDVAHAAKLVKQRRSALMCFESDAACCHRSVLAEAVSQIAELPVVNF